MIHRDAARVPPALGTASEPVTAASSSCTQTYGVSSSYNLGSARFRRLLKCSPRVSQDFFQKIATMRLVTIFVVVLASLVWKWSSIKPVLLNWLSAFLSRQLSVLLGTNVTIHSITCDLGSSVRLGVDNVVVSNIPDRRFVLPQILNLGKVTFVGSVPTLRFDMCHDGCPCDMQAGNLGVEACPTHSYYSQHTTNHEAVA